MTEHPLRTSDVHTIQDYFVTKIHLLVASGADDAQWRHQWEAQHAVDPLVWDAQNAFLWDYTLGRFIAAAHRTRQSVQEAQEESPLEQFIHAVHAGDHASALERWREARGDRDEPPARTLTGRLREMHLTKDLAGVSANLPPEYPAARERSRSERTP